MAANKTFNTRVQLKNDIEANWIKAVNFSPLLGEVIVYNAEVEGNTSHLPTNSDGNLLRGYYITYPRIKIGDGVTNVNDLPFIDKAMWEQFAQIQSLVAYDDNVGNVYFTHIQNFDNTIITFKINNITYQAKRYMTWKEWVESIYNTNRFTITEANTILSSNAYEIEYQGLPVTTTDKILPQTSYITTDQEQ